MNMNIVCKCGQELKASFKSPYLIEKDQNMILIVEPCSNCIKGYDKGYEDAKLELEDNE